ncbi:acetaldehyde dehydrogenase (acetylating) [Plantactinospora sp. KBS50]|uniref:acetaldehyde dehydrogenase (acetylating) n=1 Tax=Plantactinospora sp. KBS50 TaxID=2024580 RepID=UPI000BAAD535|nr:acetaldehyde dehydrogenase (acetylating) [Plantactinospora sp. KBS50]ASW56320.1 acetaldehyde dehydrogenase (acetylating) [Plantactinospora sp. KBS50]
MTHGVAVIGSGAVGTDLMIKVLRVSETLRMVALAGTDPASDGLARARRFGVAGTADGVAGLVALPEFADVELVFDASRADAHPHNDALLAAHGRTVVDLTPAAIGPYVVPSVNLDAHLRERNVNMVTCGGQAAVPIVAAVRRITPVAYGELVASVAAGPSGPGTPVDLDGLTATTARAIEAVGGAGRGAASLTLDPARPEPAARGAVHCLCPDTGADRTAIVDSVQAMVAQVRRYVPGYRLGQDVRIDEVDAPVPALGERFTGLRVSVALEVAGAGHHLPGYAGHLDMMTSAALRTGERLAAVRAAERLSGRSGRAS